jgi:hypothetical protein
LRLKAGSDVGLPLVASKPRCVIKRLLTASTAQWWPWGESETWRKPVGEAL